MKNDYQYTKRCFLIIVFPFGVSKGLTLINETGLETDIDATDKLIVFPGYLLECLTNGKIKGLNHFLKFNGIHNEKRFSYASFSIPRPCKSLPILNLSTKEYFDRYLFFILIFFNYFRNQLKPLKL